MLAEYWTLQGIGALQHDGIVIRGVHFTITYREILTTIDVNTIAIRVDSDIVDGSNVAASSDDRKVSTSKDRDVTNGHIAAELQGDSFIACTDGTTLYDTSLLCVVLRQSLAIDTALPRNTHIVLAFSPDQ